MSQAVGDAHTLILIDGTWAQAKKIVKTTPWLSVLCTPVQFRDGGSSTYTIRREPMPHCLSTLESIAYSLEVLEATDQARAAAVSLRKAFAAMVRHQVRSADEVGNVRFVKRPPKGQQHSQAQSRQQQPSQGRGGGSKYRSM
ncbi:DTW domain-containing protein [Tribonema minus]|uniref:tRNA-uridine aminocarboxypropyltransferase n=1 Tax=Tribonema minus TaxID=303371 RepID=A0A836CLP8_9STRA|nr:DTW domain-containing protein [Tribonema minus]